MEDGIGVFAIVHAARGENDGDEVHAGVLEQRGGGRFGEKSYINVGDVADHTIVIVDNCERSDTFVIHEFESFLEGFVATRTRLLAGR